RLSFCVQAQRTIAGPDIPSADAAGYRPPAGVRSADFWRRLGRRRFLSRRLASRAWLDAARCGDFCRGDAGGHVAHAPPRAPHLAATDGPAARQLMKRCRVRQERVLLVGLSWALMTRAPESLGCGLVSISPCSHVPL